MVRLHSGAEIDDQLYADAISSVDAIVRAPVASFLLTGQQFNKSTIERGIKQFEEALKHGSRSS